MTDGERCACVLAAQRLKAAVLDYKFFPNDFTSLAADAVEACLPRELAAGGSCHSKVLGVASALDGTYAAFYRVDAAKLGRNEFAYGRDLRFTLGPKIVSRTFGCIFALPDTECNPCTLADQLLDFFIQLVNLFADIAEFLIGFFGISQCPDSHCGKNKSVANCIAFNGFRLPCAKN